MKAASQDDKVRDWRELQRATQDAEDEIHGVGPFLEELEENHDEAVSLRSRRDALVASAMEVTAQMNAAFAVTHDSAMALRSYIKGVLGPRSEKLVRFGIKPLRGRRGRGCRG
jgi:hypothetical protein